MNTTIIQIHPAYPISADAYSRINFDKQKNLLSCIEILGKSNGQGKLRLNKDRVLYVETGSSKIKNLYNRIQKEGFFNALRSGKARNEVNNFVQDTTAQFQDYAMWILEQRVHGGSEHQADLNQIQGLKAHLDKIKGETGKLLIGIKTATDPVATLLETLKLDGNSKDFYSKEDVQKVLEQIKTDVAVDRPKARCAPSGSSSQVREERMQKLQEQLQLTDTSHTRLTQQLKEWLDAYTPDTAIDGRKVKCEVFAEQLQELRKTAVSHLTKADTASLKKMWVGFIQSIDSQIETVYQDFFVAMTTKPVKPPETKLVIAEESPRGGRSPKPNLAQQAMSSVKGWFKKREGSQPDSIESDGNPFRSVGGETAKPLVDPTEDLPTVAPLKCILTLEIHTEDSKRPIEEEVKQIEEQFKRLQQDDSQDRLKTIQELEGRLDKLGAKCLFEPKLQASIMTLRIDIRRFLTANPPEPTASEESDTTSLTSQGSSNSLSSLPDEALQEENSDSQAKTPQESAKQNLFQRLRRKKTTPAS